MAKICQGYHLPSVTGYILAGVFPGPSGFNLINSLLGGCPLVTEVVPDKSIASGIVAAVEYNAAKMVVLDSPLSNTTDDYKKNLGKCGQSCLLF